MEAKRLQMQLPANDLLAYSRNLRLVDGSAGPRQLPNEGPVAKSATSVAAKADAGLAAAQTLLHAAALLLGLLLLIRP